MAANLDVSALRIGENPLEKFEDNLRVSLDKLKEKSEESERTCVDQSQSDVPNADKKSQVNYWTTLGSCVQAVSKECTKLSLAFSKPPLPSIQDTEALVNELEVALCAVFATYRAFNKQGSGFLLHKALTTYVADLTKALLEFITSIKCGKKEEILKTIGIVWQHCETFTSLPKDVKELALRETKSCFGLINDAITESEEYNNEWKGSECDVAQNEKDDSLEKLQEQHILASIGLAKVVKSLLKKISKCFSKNARTDNVSQVGQLDAATETIKLLSPSVDDLFCGIYSESLTETLNKGLELAGLVKKLLLLCRSSHFCLDEDGSWLDFLSQALEHNFKKLTSAEHGP